MISKRGRSGKYFGEVLWRRDLEVMESHQNVSKGTRIVPQAFGELPEIRKEGAYLHSISVELRNRLKEFSGK